MPSNPDIFLFTALPCEAKPLIDFYKLKKDNTVQAFNIFCNDEIFLTITGIGKTAMAAGVAYSQALMPKTNNPPMLNIGIAGHKNHPIGTLFLIDKITDSDTGRRFYPPLVFSPPCPTHSLQTVSRPQQEYPEPELCDMEASAFYETATRFSTGELIHCLKIISDNNFSPTENINPQQVSLMIAEQAGNINKIVEILTKLTVNIVSTPEIKEFDDLLNRYRFTVSEQIQLKKLLARWQLVTGQQDLLFPAETAKTGKDFIQLLSQSINEAKFYL
ncbi:hypothetical protein MCAMS1_01038 [biofilm metagenome]